MFQSMKNVLALASLTSAAAFYESALTERQTTCSTGIHMMIAGGCAIPCPADVPSLLSTLISNITYAFPGSDQYYVPYNNDQFQAQVSTPKMIAEFNSYVAQCPQTPIVFIGYSLGGIIMMNTLCGGVSSSYTPNVIAAIAYGEETYVPNLSYDAGTCTNPAPKYPRANAATSCAAYAPAIQSYCDSTDPNCCTGGTEPYSHYTYPQFYDIKALDFIKSRYAALAQTSTTSSSTVRSTSTSISTGTTTVSTTLSTAAATTTAAAGTTTTAAAGTTTTAAAGTTTVAVPTTRASTTTTTFTGYSNSTTTRTAGSASGSASVPAAGTTTASGSATIPHYSIPSVSTVIPASVSSFSMIPNSGILVPSSVYASYVPSIVSSVASQSGAASTAGAVTQPAGAATTAAGSAGASSTSTRTGSVPAYTGAASKQVISGALAAVAGVAAYILA